MPGAYAHSGAQMPAGRVGEALAGVGEALAQRELAQPRVQQRLERVGQRAAEQFDGVRRRSARAAAGCRRAATASRSRRAPGRPRRTRESRSRASFRCVASPRACAVAASRARSCQLASQWCMPSRQYGSSSWAVTTGVMPSVSRPLPVLGGQRAQHPHQRQVGRRPRLVEPLLADRPAAVVGQPRQVGVQDQGEQPGYRLVRRIAHGRTAIATRSRLSSMSRSSRVDQVEVVGGHRRPRRRAGRPATARRPARGRSARR